MNLHTYLYLYLLVTSSVPMPSPTTAWGSTPGSATFMFAVLNVRLTPWAL